MKSYVYEVRNVNDPVDGNVVQFATKQEALNFADEFAEVYPEAEVYMVEVEDDNYDDTYHATGVEMQIRGPEVNANLADDSLVNSCEGDLSCSMRLPELEDDLDEELDECALTESSLVKATYELNDLESISWGWDKGDIYWVELNRKVDADSPLATTDFRKTYATANAAEKAYKRYIDSHAEEFSKDLDDIEDESFAEELFSQLREANCFNLKENAPDFYRR